jgi:hypothetical protein
MARGRSRRALKANLEDPPAARPAPSFRRLHFGVTA